jgi:histidinol phosphatase-like enzyme (inositol monophosphatase family)
MVASGVDVSQFKPFLTDLAAASGEVIRPWFGTSTLAVESKADTSPVTVADRSAEQVMRAMISKHFPDHGILGEEFGAERPDAEFVWVLDPIDGTKSFITATPLFVTLIGLLHQDRPVLGCIHQPILGQLMIGDGRQTTLNGKSVSVRAPRPLKEATLLTSDPRMSSDPAYGTGFDQLVKEVGLYRSFGDGFGYMLVASGWADIMIDPVMNPWDLLPLIPCLEGAGAKITDWRGGAAGGRGVKSSVAAAPGLHDEVLSFLKR